MDEVKVDRRRRKLTDEEKARRSVRYNISDMSFLEFYTTSNSIEEVEEKLKEKYGKNLPEHYVSQRASMLRKRIEEATQGKKTLKKLPSGKKQRNISALIDSFGIDLEG